MNTIQLVDNQLLSGIKIIIADDHPVYRKGIVSTLKQVQYISKITQAANGQEVLDLLKDELHDLVLMDVRMSPLDGIQTTGLIRSLYPSVRIIGLSSYDDESLVFSMIHKGANGYLLKNTDREEILLAIRKVLAGHTYYSDEIRSLLHHSLDKVMSGFTTSSEDQLEQPILREVLFLLYHEFTNDEIAKLLHKSTRTVEAYRRQLLKSTQSTNLAGLVKYATKNGVMDDVKLKMKFKEALVLR